MSDQWFYEQGGNQQGPVSEDTLKGMVSSGVIPKETLVWCEDLPDWLPFEKTDLGQGSASLVPPVAAGQSAAAPPAFIPREVKFNDDYNFGVFQALGAGWRLMVSDFWSFVGLYALVTIILGVAANFVLPVLFLTFPMFGGYLYYAVKRLRGEPGTLEDAFDGFKRRFGSLAMLSFLVCIPIFACLLPFVGFLIFASADQAWYEAHLTLGLSLLGGGALILMLISAVVGTVTTFAAMLCLDCDIGWSRAMGLGWKAYKKHFFKMTIFTILASILINAGILVLYVGCFISGAWIVCAYAYVFEKAFGDRAEITSV